MALSDRRLAAAALAVCLALAVLHTWPLGASPGGWSRNDNADTMLNEWTIAWVAHQVVRAPLRLFDANIFYPAPRSLAFSEHLFVQGLMGAPLIWSGASPVLAYNVLLIAGLTLSAWSMWLVVRRWTGSTAAGVVAGSLYAFNAHTLSRLPHLQALHLEFLPVALLALDRLLERRRLRDALLLAMFATLQALTSNYLLVFMVIGLTAAVVSRPQDWAMPFSAKTVALLGLATAIAGLVVMPFLVPYYLAQRDQGLTRTLNDVARYSAVWQDYFTTPGRLHGAIWSHGMFEGATALFPGAIAALLALYGISRGAALPRIRMTSAIGLVGVVLSFGPSMPGYALLYRWIPLLQGIRAAGRFGFLLLVAVAILAGYGVAALQTRFGSRRWWRLALVLIVVGVHVEAITSPRVYRRFDGIPQIYRAIADEPGGIVAEFPFYTPATILRNAVYELNSTVYWKPLLNGYSGYVPRHYVDAADALRDFPDDRSRAWLRRVGVTHLFVHMAAYGDRATALAVELKQTGWLTLVAEQRDIRLYRVGPGR